MKRYLYIILFLYSSSGLSQVNFVTNPSFETLSSCPNFEGQIDSAVGWGNLISGGGGTPDLYNVCCTYPSDCGVPSQTAFHTFQYPHSGNSYSGIYALREGGTNYREYIQSKLIKGFSSGHIYCVKFYASLSDNSMAFMKPLGAYLDSGEVIAFTPLGLAYANALYQPVNPQVYNTSQQLNDTVNWMRVEGSFTATGNEEYITIGNFLTDSNSDIGFFGSPTNWWAYYYIDDVSVIDVNLPPYTGNDTLVHPGDSVFIGRQPEIGLDEDCIWFVDGQPIDTIAGLWVQPDSTTTYILEQTICGNVSWDTVTVSVYGTGIGAYKKDGRGITIYPNPATNTLNIESTTKFSQLLISDVLGNVVIRQQVYNKAVSIDLSGLTKGLYFVKLTTNDGIIVKKFLKE